MRGLFAGIDRAVVAKAVRDPRRALLRLVLRSRLARRDVETDRRVLLELLSSRYQVDGEALGLEYRQSAFREWFLRRRVELARHPGPYRHGTTGQFGCEALYLLVRRSPTHDRGDRCALRRIQRAPPGRAHPERRRDAVQQRDRAEAGRAGPRVLRAGRAAGPVRLVIGDSRRELPGLMERCAPVDMFYHDSLHTYEHMVWEFGTALPHLGIGGLLASDDVLNPTDVERIFRPGPFHSFCGERRIPFQTFQNFGLAWPELAAAARERAA
jgi:hypothetical protein